MNTVCPHCGQNYEVEAEFANQVVECQECRKEFVITPERKPYSQSHDCSKRNKKKFVMLGVGFIVLVSVLAIALLFSFSQKLPYPLDKFKITDTINRSAEIGITAEFVCASENDAPKLLKEIVDKLQIKYGLPLTANKQNVYRAIAPLASKVEVAELSGKILNAEKNLLLLKEQEDDIKAFSRRVSNALNRLKQLSNYERNNNNETLEGESLNSFLLEHFEKTDYAIDKTDKKVKRISAISEDKIKEEIKNTLIANLKDQEQILEEQLKLNEEKLAMVNGSHGQLTVQLYCRNSVIVFTANATGNAPMDRLHEFCKQAPWYEESRKWFGWNN